MIALKSNIVRNDSQGFGHYGASRGDRVHNGLDLLCLPDLQIKATERLNFIRIKSPYAGMSGGLWKNEAGDELTIFYCNPIETNLSFCKGDIIATCQNVASMYSDKMMPHIHIEIRVKGKRINPNEKIKITK